MDYWWVSQNKTWKQEIGGGYMWAPNRDKAGRTPFRWATMNEVQGGDVIFSFVRQGIRAVGVAKGPAFASPRPAVQESYPMRDRTKSTAQVQEISQRF
jgi:hypothetical protein